MVWGAGSGNGGSGRGGGDRLSLGVGIPLPTAFACTPRGRALPAAWRGCCGSVAEDGPGSTTSGRSSSPESEYCRISTEKGVGWGFAFGHPLSTPIQQAGRAKEDFLRFALPRLRRACACESFL